MLLKYEISTFNNISSKFYVVKINEEDVWDIDISFIRKK